VRLLLDTVALIFALKAPERLSKHATAVFANPDDILLLSSISISEIAIKAVRGKLGLSLADVQDAFEDLDLRILPYTMDHAFRLFDLPFHHADPFDRQIIAQALCEEIPVVTSDEKFSLYKGLKVIW
jgi:PIN domain nuclease of toxin-antitoxin system